LLAKPVVDRLEHELEGQAKLIRLDLMSAVGRQAAVRFRVRAVPTLVVVDGKGQVAATQVGLIRPGEVRSQVNALTSN